MGATIRCCKCGGGFDERALEGVWLERRCPLCGKKLSEETYDKSAAHLGKRRARERDELALARFYTSEWFRLACAGQGSEAADKGLVAAEKGLAVLQLTHYASEEYGMKKYYEKIRRQVGIPCEFYTDERLR